MKPNVLDQLAAKSITKEKLVKKVKQNFTLLPEIIEGVSSSKAAIRYGCGKVLMELSEGHPEKLYPYIDFFIEMLSSNYRILAWQAMCIVANLTKVDKDKKFDLIFDTYYSFLTDEYMVTVANVVGHSAKIALAKPYLIPKITQELLNVETIQTTPHLTKECKKVIVEKAIRSLDMFFPYIENKKDVISFVKRQATSSRKTLQTTSEAFLSKWNK
jgi:hypothetical protein